MLGAAHSLRWVLTGPFVALSLLLAGAVGSISYLAGRRAVDTLAAELLTSLVQRTGQAIERQVQDAANVLETAAPSGLAAPVDPLAEEATLRTRFWSATSLHLEPNQYVYYAARDGSYLGLIRRSATEADLLSVTPDAGARTSRHVVGIAGAPGPANLRETDFEPRARPWFRAAADSPGEVWTPIYVDFDSKRLVATRARRVLDAQGSFGGVVATDVSLAALSDFLRRLPLPPGGVAFVVEPNGAVVATSHGEHLRVRGELTERIVLGNGGDSVLEQPYLGVREALSGTNLDAPRTVRLEQHGGDDWEAGFARVRDGAGLDWGVVVAVPRSALLGDVPSIAKRSLLAAVVASLVIVVLGLWVVRRLSREVDELSDAARRIGDGDLQFSVPTQSVRDLSLLADSFNHMLERLRTDRLTGLANREVARQRLTRRLQNRRRADGELSAVLFIDLDRFKSINDRFGHQAGDEVLREMGRRLRGAVRDTDLVARWAGDEFLVVLDGVGARGDAELVRTKLELTMREAVSLGNGTTETLGGTIGIAVFPGDGATVDDLIAAADADMYERKKSAR